MMTTHLLHHLLSTSWTTVIGRRTIAVGFHLSGCQRLSSHSSYYDHNDIRSMAEEQLKPTEYFNFAKDIVGSWANKKPSHPALLLTDGHDSSAVTYHGLYQEAHVLATALSNPTPPRIALVILPKIKEWWVINVAGSICGTIVSPATTMLSAQDVSYRLQESGADCIITTAELAIAFDSVSSFLPRRIFVSENHHDVRDGWESYHQLMDRGRGQPMIPCVASKGDDTVQLFFTSGTTGKPKMVPHTQASYGFGHIPTAKYWLDLKEDDLIWNISDTGWAKAAWSSLYIPFITGSTAFIHQMQRFNAEEVLQSLCDYPVTVLCAPPTAYRAMLQYDLSKYQFQGLRHCVSAGEPLNPEVMTIWLKHTGLHLYEGFGQTETTLVSCVYKGMELRPGSMGKPAPGYRLTIINEEQQELGPYEEGLCAICLKKGYPVGLFKGYLSDEKKTSEVFVGDYYMTGDRAYYDDDGYFWFVGRGDDVILSSGYRIGPFEVESLLLEHPAVAESAVVSSPDSLRGEVVKAFIVLTEDYKNYSHQSLIPELQDHIKSCTAPYKYPRKIEFVENLPKTVSGKIRRVELRQREWRKLSTE